jgi:hypothetical protein
LHTYPDRVPNFQDAKFFSYNFGFPFGAPEKYTVSSKSPGQHGKYKKKDFENVTKGLRTARVLKISDIFVEMQTDRWFIQLPFL